MCAWADADLGSWVTDANDGKKAGHHRTKRVITTPKTRYSGRAVELFHADPCPPPDPQLVPPSAQTTLPRFVLAQIDGGRFLGSACHHRIRFCGSHLCARRRRGRGDTADGAVSQLLLLDGDRRLDRNRARSFDDQLLRLLPREAGTSEVTVGTGALVERSAQLQVLDDSARAKIEIVRHDLQQLLLTVLRSAVIEYCDGQRFSQADGVRHLHQATAADARLHKRLGDPAGCISSRSIDLGEILTREGTTTMGAPAAVRVHDDLASGQAGIALRTADDKHAARIDVHDRVGVELFERNLIGVLQRNNNRVHALRDARARLKAVLGRDLGLRVRAGPPEIPTAAQLGNLLVQAMGQHHRQRHTLFRFIGGITEHQPLRTT
uniref:Uncharacterized protein n=1 Tax=Anopheles atroparvus TaxID=41427 RepID=A0A182IV73_ANOAO